MKEYLKLAVKSIKNNKARSFLTMIGIIIGISSVIMIISIITRYVYITFFFYNV